MKCGNLAGSHRKKTGVLFATTSQLPSSVRNLTEKPLGSRAQSCEPLISQPDPAHGNARPTLSWHLALSLSLLLMPSIPDDQCPSIRWPVRPPGQLLLGPCHKTWCTWGGSLYSVSWGEVLPQEAPDTLGSIAAVAKWPDDLNLQLCRRLPPERLLQDLGIPQRPKPLFTSTDWFLCLYQGSCRPGTTAHENTQVLTPGGIPFLLIQHETQNIAVSLNLALIISVGLCKSSKDPSCSRGGADVSIM
jgi:hypothetical protein